MPISLNKVNAEAYAKVAAALEQNGKAAVEHATGTGKSCIAWQLIADHPQASFIWLVYGAARLTLRREDVRRYNDGVLPENLIFCDCSVLAEASAEEWVRLASRKPDYLIFDCYHEVTAACWAKSAQRLLRLCPEAKLLGLTVPNSTDQKCQAAAELFEGTVVSRMTVGEGMALGTLPVPSNYAAMLWPQEGQMNLLRARIKNLHLPAQTNALSAQYDEINWSVRQAENPIALMPRVLTDTQGRYLAIFESEDYLDEVQEQLEEFLRTVDSNAHFYRAECDCLRDAEAVKQFCTSTETGPKVLFCVNSPGVQQPIEGLALPGVGGLRPQAHPGVRPDRPVRRSGQWPCAAKGMHHRHAPRRQRAPRLPAAEAHAPELPPVLPPEKGTGSPVGGFLCSGGGCGRRAG